MKRILVFDVFCGMPGYLKNSIYTVGVQWILSSTARTLKVLDLTVSLYNKRISVFLKGICEELEALAGHNMLEALAFKVLVDWHTSDTDDFIGSTMQEVEKVVVKPGWSTLRKVSFKVSCRSR